MTSQEIALEAHNLKKVYHRGSESIVAVDDVSLTVRKGEFVSFIGPSGSGKTTLINILGCLDNATAGSLKISGESVFAKDCSLSETELTRIRRRVFGYIFQKFYLVPTLTVYENVLLPFAFFRKPEAKADPIEILTFLGLGERLDHRPSELSGERCKGWPSPGLSLTSLKSCWPTSQREIWIPSGARRSARS